MTTDTEDPNFTGLTFIITNPKDPAREARMFDWKMDLAVIASRQEQPAMFLAEMAAGFMMGCQEDQARIADLEKAKAELERQVALSKGQLAAQVERGRRLEGLLATARIPELATITTSIAGLPTSQQMEALAAIGRAMFRTDGLSAHLYRDQRKDRLAAAQAALHHGFATSTYNTPRDKP